MTYTRSTPETDKEIQYWKSEVNRMHDELLKTRSDNEMLKETVVRLAMKLVGVEY